jgi:hypothetical protein
MMLRYFKRILTHSILSLRESSPVFTSNSGLRGGSYGDVMPVNSEISPLRALEVHTLGVPLFTHLKRGAAIDFQKIFMWKQAPLTRSRSL